MKLKHIFWILSAFVAVACMAAGVAVFVNKYLNGNKNSGYIECDCDVDSDPVLDEESCEK